MEISVFVVKSINHAHILSFVNEFWTAFFARLKWKIFRLYHDLVFSISIKFYLLTSFPWRYRFRVVVFDDSSSILNSWFSPEFSLGWHSIKRMERILFFTNSRFLLTILLWLFFEKTWRSKLVIMIDGSNFFDLHISDDFLQSWYLLFKFCLLFSIFVLGFQLTIICLCINLNNWAF